MPDSQTRRSSIIVPELLSSPSAQSRRRASQATVEDDDFSTAVEPPQSDEWMSVRSLLDQPTPPSSAPPASQPGRLAERPRRRRARAVSSVEAPDRAAVEVSGFRIPSPPRPPFDCRLGPYSVQILTPTNRVLAEWDGVLTVATEQLGSQPGRYYSVLVRKQGERGLCIQGVVRLAVEFDNGDDFWFWVRQLDTDAQEAPRDVFLPRVRSGRGPYWPDVEPVARRRSSVDDFPGMLEQVRSFHVEVVGVYGRAIGEWGGVVLVEGEAGEGGARGFVVRKRQGARRLLVEQRGVVRLRLVFANGDEWKFGLERLHATVGDGRVLLRRARDALAAAASQPAEHADATLDRGFGRHPGQLLVHEEDVDENGNQEAEMLRLRGGGDVAPDHDFDHDEGQSRPYTTTSPLDFPNGPNDPIIADTSRPFLSGPPNPPYSTSCIRDPTASDFQAQWRSSRAGSGSDGDDENEEFLSAEETFSDWDDDEDDERWISRQRETSLDEDDERWITRSEDVPSSSSSDAVWIPLSGSSSSSSSSSADDVWIPLSGSTSSSSSAARSIRRRILQQHRQPPSPRSSSSPSPPPRNPRRRATPVTAAEPRSWQEEAWERGGLRGETGGYVWVRGGGVL